MVIPQQISQYHVFLSSPGDMEEERKEVRKFFDEWNDTNTYGVHLKVIGDDTHGSGGEGHPQDLINKQLLERYRNSLVLVIGLLGQRFGTKTKNADSGTEEEFNWALKQRRQRKKSGASDPFPEIKLFFRNKNFEAPLNVPAIEAALEQYKKVAAFQESCQSGKSPIYYREFHSNNFRQVFSDDLRLWLSLPDRPWLAPAIPKTSSSTGRQIKRVQATAGKSFIEPNTDLKMLSVPEGRFQIGQGRTDFAAWVRLSSFWISETPVTNKQYAMFLKMESYEEPDFWTNDRFNDTQQPVVGVSWHAAMAFCSWLSRITGLKFSLPSEAQWEYAARGTDGRLYPWGNDPPTPRLARYQHQYDRPASTGSYIHGLGPFGALEQAGNVWEWCLDVWHRQAYKQWIDLEPLNPVNTVKELEHEDRRILRGGCWIDPPDLLLATTRYCRRERQSPNRVGFRVVVNLPDDK